MRKLSGITLKGLNISKGAGKLVRRKVDVRTVCIALEVDADASEKMHRTRRLYGQACDLLIPIVVSDTDRKDRLWQRYNLHKAAYPMVRTQMPDLGSQLACNVMRSVSSMYRSWIRNHPKFSTDKKMVLPSISFRNPVVHLDKNTLRFLKNYTEASVYTVGQWACHCRSSSGKVSAEPFGRIYGSRACRNVEGESDFQAWRMQPRLEVRHQRQTFPMGAAHYHREKTQGSLFRQLVFESSHGRRCWRKQRRRTVYRPNLQGREDEGRP